MCLVTLAWKCHPRWRLLMAGNRDEFHDRPSAGLSRWEPPAGGVIAGRDLRSGGTWMGTDGHGRAAVVTNVRAPGAAAGGPSRGALVADYLASPGAGAGATADALAPRAADYAPFNLLLADATACHYLGNHPLSRRALAPGVHGMSNGALEPPWPKTRRLTTALERWLALDDAPLDGLWNALADEWRPDDSALPATGIAPPLERHLAAAFIRGPAYGTRASTVLALDADGHGFICERRFGPGGERLDETRIAF
ncbi:NRDE family protein [Stenotrophomonas mori]|uniref:NRDE family protein n=1 Tax=Stenotrophomonas mori TaxID=2871096 RepID=A0ABT0SKJ1_9GAMM|nr:NRDE family protein [Stenotrophomonas mori]MCL7715603.1 NRDE family protein [Stenotrophomonas mori]